METASGERLAPLVILRNGRMDRRLAVVRGWLLVIPSRPSGEEVQETDSGERLAPSHPKETRVGRRDRKLTVNRCWL